jgi:hypothetical protein
MSPSFMSPGAVDWRMKTVGGVSHNVLQGVELSAEVENVPSSSRTLSPTVTLVSWLL